MAICLGRSSFRILQRYLQIFRCGDELQYCHNEQHPSECTFRPRRHWAVFPAPVVSDGAHGHAATAADTDVYLVGGRTMRDQLTIDLAAWDLGANAPGMGRPGSRAYWGWLRARYLPGRR